MLPSRITESAVSFASEDNYLLSGRCCLAPATGGSSSASPTIAVIAHPNPADGGTMQNKVVDVTTRTLASLGMSTLRFDFRGVGKSEGEMSDGLEEDRDIRAAIRYLSDTVREHSDHGNAPIRLVLAGFSFGSAMAMKAISAGLTCNQLLLIGLPLSWRPISSLPGDANLSNKVANDHLDTHVIIGDHDEFCPVDQAQRWIRIQQENHWARLRVVADAGHFFHKKLPDLAEAITASLAEAHADAQAGSATSGFVTSGSKT